MSGVIDLVRSLKRWRDERLDLANANQSIGEAWIEYADLKLAFSKGELSSDEFFSSSSTVVNAMTLSYAAKAQIETRRMMARAIKWDIPIPDEPELPGDDNEDWAWHSVHEKHYLTTIGRARLRRETLTEMEIRYRPGLSWAAFIISVISLLIAVLKS